MDVISDIVTRLVPLGVPVKRPEEAADVAEYSTQTDSKGRPLANAKRGQEVYLSTGQPGAGGYVQIEEPLPISEDGDTATIWVTIAAVASTDAASATLARNVRLAIAGAFVTRAPTGPYRPRLPGLPTQVDPGVWVTRPTYELTLFGGLVP